MEPSNIRARFKNFHNISTPDPIRASFYFAAHLNRTCVGMGADKPEGGKRDFCCRRWWLFYHIQNLQKVKSTWAIVLDNTNQHFTLQISWPGNLQKHITIIQYWPYMWCLFRIFEFPNLEWIERYWEVLSCSRIIYQTMISFLKSHTLICSTEFKSVNQGTNFECDFFWVQSRPTIQRQDFIYLHDVEICIDTLRTRSSHK